MNLMRKTKLDTDNTGLETLEHDVLDLPIIFLYDEVEKYNQGYIKWHWHPEMQFFVVRDNPVEVFVEDRRIVLRKGEGMWINSNRMHMIKCLEGMHSAMLWTVLMLPEFISQKTSPIYKKYIQPWIEDAELSYVLFLESIAWHEEAVELLVLAFELLEKRAFGYEMSVHNCISRLWLTMLEHQKEVPKQVISATELHSQTRLKTMASYIHKNYAQHITLIQIADSAHVSKSECIRCFKKNLDVTPIQYLTEYRLEAAEKILLSSDDMINTIAARCGFEDFSYFARLFKERYGSTPSKYRKEHRSR